MDIYMKKIRDASALRSPPRQEIAFKTQGNNHTRPYALHRARQRPGERSTHVARSDDGWGYTIEDE